MFEQFWYKNRKLLHYPRTTHKFKKTLIDENIDATHIESGSDEDDAPLYLYHLDIIVTATKQASNTLGGYPCKKRIVTNSIQCNVLNFVVRVPKEGKTGDKDKNNDDNGNNVGEYV